MVRRKTKLTVYISSDTDKQLRELIMIKYGEYGRGYLSYEVEQALKNWILTHRSKFMQQHATTYTQDTLSQYSIKKVNPYPQTAKVYSQVLKAIELKYSISLEPGAHINITHLREAIAEVRGRDPRTIKKWINRFLKEGLIKRIGERVFELK